ncbi:MAG: hypothetical protein IJC89_05160 [Clostridia bacterium]|nr:hypothetical protein [Clostridia bacterium]
MKLHCARLLCKEECPVVEIIPLRCTVEALLSERIIYLYPDGEYPTWGISVTLKEGYTLVKPTGNQLLDGETGGKRYWVCVEGRELSFDYIFQVKKGNKVVASYRVISVL